MLQLPSLPEGVRKVPGFCTSRRAGTADHAYRITKKAQISAPTNQLFSGTVPLYPCLTRVLFIRHQTEENGFKQGGTTWTFLIRNVHFCFPLQSALKCLPLGALMNTTQASTGLKLQHTSSLRLTWKDVVDITCKWDGLLKLWKQTGAYNLCHVHSVNLFL